MGCYAKVNGAWQSMACMISFSFLGAISWSDHKIAFNSVPLRTRVIIAMKCERTLKNRDQVYWHTTLLGNVRMCVCVRAGKGKQIYLLYRRRILAPGHARHVLKCPLLVMLGEVDATQTQKHHACIRIGTLCFLFFLLLYFFFYKPRLYNNTSTTTL